MSTNDDQLVARGLIKSGHDTAESRSSKDSRKQLQRWDARLRLLVVVSAWSFFSADSREE